MTYHLGVDLGTTYTAAAVFRDGRAQIVELGSRAAAVPSVLFVKEGEGLLIGEAATRRGASDPARGLAPRVQASFWRSDAVDTRRLSFCSRCTHRKDLALGRRQRSRSGRAVLPTA